MLYTHRWSANLTLLSSYVLLCVLLFGTGCQGKGSPVPPVISDITPTGVLGVPDQTVTFSATVTGTGPFTYAWNFDGGTDPATSTSSTPAVDLGSVGEYEGSLTVTDSLSSSTTAFFDFEVQALPNIVSVAPEGDVGRPLGRVQFEAITTGFVESYAWNFGGGANPDTSTESSPEVDLQEPGTYNGTLIVFADGTAVETFPFEYTVEAVTAPTWSLTRLGPQSSGALNTPSRSIKMVSHLGKLALVYNSPDGEIIYARAKVEVPNGCCDWEEHVLAETGQVAFARTLVSIGGRLALAYRGTGVLRIAISDVEEPTSTGDWRTYALSTGSIAPPWSMIEADGKLRILAATFGDGAQILEYWTASVEIPESDSDWSSTQVTEGPMNAFTALMLRTVGSTIQAVGLQSTDAGSGGTVSLVQSDSFDPEGPEDWRLQNLSVDQAVASRVADLVEDEGLAFVAIPKSQDSAPRPLFLARAIVAEPTAAINDLDNWKTFQLTAAGDDNLGSAFLERSIGRLAVGFTDRNAQSICLGRQIGIESTQFSSWEIETIESGLGLNGGTRQVLVALGDRLAVAYSIPETGEVGIAVAEADY